MALDAAGAKARDRRADRQKARSGGRARCARHQRGGRREHGERGPRARASRAARICAPRTLIAFGGAAPLHAARVAEKLGIGRVLIPANAGVGSAVGLLRAPVAYEVVRGRLMRLETFDAAAANRLLAEMRAEAEAIVRRGAPDAALTEQRSALHALSRPGPRDHGRASGARLHGRGSRRPCASCSRTPTAGSIAAIFPVSRSRF